MRSDAKMLVEIPIKLIPIEDGHILFVVVNHQEEGDVSYRRASSRVEMLTKLLNKGLFNCECVQIGTLQPPGRWCIFPFGKTSKFTIKKFDKERKENKYKQ